MAIHFILMINAGFINLTYTLTYILLYKLEIDEIFSAISKNILGNIVILQGEFDRRKRKCWIEELICEAFKCYLVLTVQEWFSNFVRKLAWVCYLIFMQCICLKRIGWRYNYYIYNVRNIIHHLSNLKITVEEVIL